LALVLVAYWCATTSAVISPRNTAMVMVSELNMAEFATMPSCMAWARVATPDTSFFATPSVPRGLEPASISSLSSVMGTGTAREASNHSPPPRTRRPHFSKASRKAF
jgi:hypothetical protein